MARAATRLDPDELAALEDQRDFLLRSLRDLEREHDAGDLDQHDYETLRDDYTGRAAETLRAIEQQRAAFADARGSRSLGRRLATIGGVVAFAVVAGVLVASSLGARQAGDSATGGIDTRQSPSQRAQACVGLIQPSAPRDAIECFEGVLDDDPRNAVALAWLAWQLELSADLLPEGREGEAAALKDSASSLIERAVEVNPEYSYGRAFRAVLAYRRGNYEDAQQYLTDFRDRNPSPDAESVITSQNLDERIAEGLAEAAEGGTTTTTVP